MTCVTDVAALVQLPVECPFATAAAATMAAQLSVVDVFVVVVAAAVPNAGVVAAARESVCWLLEWWG